MCLVLQGSQIFVPNYVITRSILQFTQYFQDNVQNRTPETAGRFNLNFNSTEYQTIYAQSTLRGEI